MKLIGALQNNKKIYRTYALYEKTIEGLCQSALPPEACGTPFRALQTSLARS